jgi:exosortase A-associated hydrolase 2
MAPEAFFLSVADAPEARRFCLYHAAAPLRGALIYVHPFAEEMNKARRMAALQARLLAQHGYAVLQIDLHGCGDSAGNFGDATWESWRQDVVAAFNWLRTRCPAVPMWFWGLRSGCLLAAEAAQGLAVPINFLFWQPTLAGKQTLQQFLRMKVAGDMLSGAAKGAMAALKAELAAGKTVEIAGYALSAALARGMEHAELQPPAQPARLCWFELSTRPAALLTPATVQRIDAWRAAGFSVNSAVLPAPSFWQSTEIEEALALLEATLAALQA